MKSGEKYDFCVIITTYNREEMLKNLLDDIFKNTNYKILVTIFDDGSKDSYNLEGYDVKYIKYIKNNGLKKSFLLQKIWNHNSELETHAFETHLHRLRKKIDKFFKDKKFIIEKNSSYYLSK